MIGEIKKNPTAGVKCEVEEISEGRAKRQTENRRKKMRK